MFVNFTFCPVLKFQKMLFRIFFMRINRFLSMLKMLKIEKEKNPKIWGFFFFRKKWKPPEKIEFFFIFSWKKSKKRAKFGIFGDGKEIPQLALAKTFMNGDFRAGYYRDQTIALATGIVSLEEWFVLIETATYESENCL